MSSLSCISGQEWALAWFFAFALSLFGLFKRTVCAYSIVLVLVLVLVLVYMYSAIALLELMFTLFSYPILH